MQVWPTGSGVVWAWSQDITNVHGAQAMVRSPDGGLHWSDVTPPGFARQTDTRVIIGSFALDASHAWIVSSHFDSEGTSQLMRTDDGGALWTALGGLPEGGCSVQFVTAVDGWCIAADAAAGSEGVRVYRTGDSGAHWQLISSSARPDTGPPVPGQLPFSCDKILTFTALELGWAEFSCAGWMPPLYRSADGGRTWTQADVASPPVDLRDGFFVGAPATDGNAAAVPFSTYQPAQTVIYRSTDGGTRWSIVAPPVRQGSWITGMPTPTVWRLIGGTLLQGTDNAGRSWFQVTMDHSFTPKDLGGVQEPDAMFTSPSTGYIVANDGAWKTIDDGRHWTKLPIPST